MSLSGTLNTMEQEVAFIKAGPDVAVVILVVGYGALVTTVSQIDTTIEPGLETIVAFASDCTQLMRYRLPTTKDDTVIEVVAN